MNRNKVELREAEGRTKKVAIFLIIALFVGSCSLFDKPSMNQEEIDAMVAQNVRLQEDLANTEHEASVQKMQAEQCAQVLAELQKAEEEMASGNYHVIAGSFKTIAYAEDFAKKIKEMGGTGTIVSGPSDFSLVAYSSYNSLRESVKAMEEARMNVSSEAWVYMER